MIRIHAIMLVICALLVLCAHASAASETSATGEVIINCQRFGLVYDEGLDTCVDPASSAATSVMAPLLGAQGSIISNEEMLKQAEANSAIDVQNMLTDGGESSTVASACNNGIYSDGCEDGTKRLCTLIPNLPVAPMGGNMLLMLSMLGSMAGVRWHVYRAARRRRSSSVDRMDASIVSHADVTKVRPMNPRPPMTTSMPLR